MGFMCYLAQHVKCRKSSYLSGISKEENQIYVTALRVQKDIVVEKNIYLYLYIYICIISFSQSAVNYPQITGTSTANLGIFCDRQNESSQQIICFFLFFILSRLSSVWHTDSTPFHVHSWLSLGASVAQRQRFCAHNGRLLWIRIMFLCSVHTHILYIWAIFIPTYMWMWMRNLPSTMRHTWRLIVTVIL